MKTLKHYLFHRRVQLIQQNVFGIHTTEFQNSFELLSNQPVHKIGH
jgi:hypothetical protein